MVKPVRIKFEGGRDLERRLQALEKRATRKTVARRVLKQSGQPIADQANRLAPDDASTDGGLSQSYAVSTKLTKTQKRALRRQSKSAVEMYVGTSDPAGLQQEFGNSQHGAQPHLRPAWDGEKDQVLKSIIDGMEADLTKVIARIAKRKANKR
ncbi:MAG: HK97-gp10 family putative phage morphogenesis protein [Pseudomonadota bacterium]